MNINFSNSHSYFVTAKRCVSFVKNTVPSALRKLLSKEQKIVCCTKFDHVPQVSGENISFLMVVSVRWCSDDDDGG